MSTTAVAKIGSPKGALTTVRDLTDRMREIQDMAFVCSPFANLDSIPEFFRVSERVVNIDPDPQKGEVYTSSQFCRQGEVALTKPGLMKLWLASGGQVIASRRTDDRSDPHLCSWECVGEYRQIDGNVVRVHGNRTLDYRDGSEQIKGLKPGDIAQKRRAIQSLAETFALERMQRSAINLQQKYSAKDLGAKPFVCYALVPDVSREQDPVIRRMAAAQALGIVNELYGAGSGQAAMTGQQPAGLIETHAGKVDSSTGEVVDEPAGGYEDLPPEAPAQEPPSSTPDAPEAVCEHSCGGGCQVAITPADAENTRARLGIALCRKCFPGRHFDYGQHAEMTTLAYPKRPKMTPTEAWEWAKKLQGGA